MGGSALQSSISDSPIYYAAGGSGWGTCSSVVGEPALGYGGPGCGESKETSATSGTIILRYPKNVFLQVTEGNLELETWANGDDLISEFSSGSGVVKMSIPIRGALKRPVT